MEKQSTSSEIVLTLGDVEGLSIHETTESYGSEGLLMKTHGEICNNFDDDEQAMLLGALGLGLELHRDDRRTNGPYVDHIMRVGVRIMYKFNIYDEPNMVAAAFLHDVVEDHPEDLLRFYGRYTVPGEDDKTVRTQALDVIGEQLNPDVRYLVDEMSFMCDPESEADKLTQYCEYSKNIIENHPRARVIKLSDFIDNAVGNHYTDGALQSKLDVKYVDDYIKHIYGIFATDSRIPEAERGGLLKQLYNGYWRCQARLRET